MKTEPTEAYRMIEEYWYAIPYMGTDYPQDPDIVVDKKDVYEIAKKAFKEGQSSSKIKQLDWEEYNNEWEADAPFGTYRIEITNDQFKIYLIGGLISRRNSLEEAKQAAQEHFEKK